MHAVFKLSSVLLGKEFLLHRNHIVFSGPLRVFYLFTKSKATCKQIKNPQGTRKHYMISMKQKFFSEKYAREFEDCMHI